MHDDEIERLATEAIMDMLEGVAEEADVANAFSNWAYENQVSPIGMLAILMTIYVHLRTYLPESVLMVFFPMVIRFAEHTANKHPEAFFTHVEGETVPLPFVKEGDDFGSGQEMLRTLAEFKKGDFDGAS